MPYVSFLLDANAITDGHLLQMVKDVSVINCPVMCFVYIQESVRRRS